MYHFYRTFLITVIWLSLLAVPYMLVAYACYAGLCGGSAATKIRNEHPHYISIIGYSIWLYPLIALYALYHSRKLAEYAYRSTTILWLPLLCLLPFIYVMHQTSSIETKETQQREAYYRAQPNDFVCAPGKFIRFDPLQPEHTYFFTGTPDGKGSTVSYFYKTDELNAFLKNNKIDGSQCKNQKGIPFSNFIKP
ncbi:hypothetical protein [Legionella feeleii]|uniref:Transmembrane protein n=1 Tax=Legionella feeleii TaxID=453 RepID=A0A0W0TKU7_9GAMM|nr:hypothetical protein [Legionella feeleii]KTC96223.1 hypothetical protein Lfee_2021 [Legionella feeleii]SPX61002.1 Uncharacterised protein [Legionella feeleii]